MLPTGHESYFKPVNIAGFCISSQWRKVVGSDAVSNRDLSSFRGRLLILSIK